MRDPARAPSHPGAEVVQGGDYSDGEAMRRAFDGIEVLFLPSAGEDPDRVSVHRSAVDAAAAAGVGRLVYTSFVGAAPDCVFTFGRDHFHTEEHIRASGVGFTFLRDSIYLDYIPFFTSAEGIIQGPAGDGRVGAVARDDIADVAVEALLDPQHEGRAYEVTGREAFTLAEAAEILTRHSRPRGPLRRGDDRGGARLTRAERRPRLGDRGLGDHLHLDRRGRARRRHGHRGAGGGA